MESLQIVDQSANPPIVANASTKQDLLIRAKAAIEAGDKSLHDAAEALGLAQEEHSATQREMAEAVGKSAPWVNALLKWRRSGYRDDSPFGPKTRAGRVQRAEQRARATGKPSTAVCAQASAVPLEATSAEPATGAVSLACSNDAKLLAEFKYAVDHWLPGMSYEAKREAVSYVLNKSGVPVS